MKLEQSFEVSAPLEQVWQALIDVERVAPCLPGAAVTGRNDDGSYTGTFSVKVGPTSASYSGKLEMRDIDAAAHTATMYANGSDKRGQGGATATIVSTLAEIEPNRTRVEVLTDYRITGRLARFGRGGMIEDISQKLLRKFADCLQSSLAEGPGAAPAAEASTAAPLAGASAAVRGGSGNGMSPTAEDVSSRAEGSAAEATPPPVSAGSPQQAEPLRGLSLAGGVLIDRMKQNPAPLIAVGAAVVLLAVRRHHRSRRRRR